MDVWELLRDAIVLGVVLLGWVAAVVLIRRRWRDLGAHPGPVALIRGRSATLETLAACLLWTALTVPPMFQIGLIGYPVYVPGHQLAALPLLGIILVATLQAIGASTWPRQSAAVMAAGLEPRTSDNITSTYTRRLIRVWLSALVTVSIAFSLMSSGPRSVSRILDSVSAQTADPWPGWLWTLPLLVGSAIAMLLIQVAVRAIAAQPRFDVPRDCDIVVRRRLANGLLRSAALTFGLSVAGLTLVAGGALQQLGSGWAVYVQDAGPGPASPAHQSVGTVLVLLSFAIALGAIISACWPERGIPRSRPTAGLAALP